MPRKRSASAATCAPCRPGAWSRRRWWRWSSPTPCWRSSAATRSPRRGATSPATWSTCPRRCRCGDRVMAPRAVIVGPPGSGKSTVARLVAERLGLSARDTDDDVESAAGATVSDVFVEQGEEGFRALERSAVAAALTEHDGILAVGGGAVLDPGTRELLRGRTVVFLDVGIKDAASRIGL